jgi:hypothetical protein
VKRHNCDVDGGGEGGIKKSGINVIFHLSRKWQKRKGAETERGRNGKEQTEKRHKGKRHTLCC